MSLGKDTPGRRWSRCGCRVAGRRGRSPGGCRRRWRPAGSWSSGSSCGGRQPVIPGRDQGAVDDRDLIDPASATGASASSGPRCRSPGAPRSATPRTAARSGASSGSSASRSRPATPDRAASKAHCRPGRPSAISSPPRSATSRTSLRNWAGCSPVNGTIHSGRDAVITCTTQHDQLSAPASPHRGYETSLSAGSVSSLGSPRLRSG